MSGNPPPQFSPPPKTKGGRRDTTCKKLREKRRVGNTHDHLGTRLNSDVTSSTSPLAIEGIKDGDGKVNLACRFVKTEGENGGKEKGTAPVEHTTAPAHSACLAVDACCECGPTSTCKTARCEFRKAAHVCVSCRCLERCVNHAPQTQQKTCGAMGTRRERRRGNASGGEENQRRDIRRIKHCERDWGERRRRLARARRTGTQRRH